MKFAVVSGAAFFAASVLGACNPTTSSSCPADKALALSFKEDFSSKSKYFDEVKSEGLSYSDNGLELKIAKRFDNPSIKSNFYIMFGKVEVVMQAAKGKGIISSFYLQSDDLDEIDIELFGGDAYQFQSNWFSKGSTTTYDRGVYHNMDSSPLDNFHTYTVEYTKDAVTWSLDGNLVRTLKPDNGQGFPQTPMYIMAGTWAGGDPSNEPGTIEWAGGTTDYSQAPFLMYIKSVIVADYSTGSEYSYSDQSGDWTSIDAKDGKVSGREDQAKEDFEKLQSGGSVSNSYSAASSSTSDSSSSSEPLSSSPSSSSASSSSEASSSSSSEPSSSSASSSSESSSQQPSSSEKPSSLQTASSAEKSEAPSSSAAAPTSSEGPASKAAEAASATSASPSAEASTKSGFTTSTKSALPSGSSSILASSNNACSQGLSLIVAVASFFGYLL